MLRRGALLVVFLQLLLVVAEAEQEALPMELYFSAAELSRIAGYGEEPVSSVSVSGQVTCELCARPSADLLALELPGAKVAVICEPADHNPQVPNFAFAKTDEYGNFTIDLPSQFHATPDLEKACTVKVLQLPTDSCQFLHQHRSTYSIRRLNQEDGIRTYTTGVIRLQHSGTPSNKCV